MKILITGGAGFVGSSLARLFKENAPQNKIVVFDNLRRRGSELNLPIFKKAGIEFVHGDIRSQSDFSALADSFDLFIEASAEPSVLAGTGGDCNYLFDTNLRGTFNCLEFARRQCEAMFFISTSRVYSIPDLLALPLVEQETRLEINDQNPLPHGLTAKGINEEFNVARYRSLYGATKLASELLIQEYCAAFNLKAMINRCGVIAGPGQWGKTDQGVFALWVANHFFKRKLRYTGFGGIGKQVRDLLHPADLFSLIIKQLPVMAKYSGEVFNIGGGLANSVSLLEYTGICQEVTGNKIEINSDPETNKVDIPYYVSDCSRAQSVFGWQPEKSVWKMVGDIHLWLQENRAQVEEIL
ncbi:MAG: NAD-dependent epimerase/dehydratase family protein [Proteobacteria bacterium]|nr:NAD-dependent epimerase/dehydratase family protein [Pseudomonadota bacterium]MBU1715649.1 NAD-dependent epimerase/dehydratase family protein [Pseudomonadota bacterium]